MTISYEQFEAVEMRVGTIVRVELFPEARKPAYKLWIDFGPEIGEKQSSAQITVVYQPEELIGRQVIAVLNFETKKIAGFRSEVLTLGVNNESNDVVLLQPSSTAPNGTRVY